jgi:hypothetical protein
MSEREPNTDAPGPTPSGSQLDWGLGEYESTAAELEPVARHVVERAGIERGERVLAPGGRGLVTIWIPEGAIDAMVGIAVQAVRAATSVRSERFPWSDRDAVSGLFAAHGAAVSFEESSLGFVAESPEAYLAGPQAEHPMHIAQRPLLERAGTYEATREQMLAALRKGNEDPAAFRVTSRYLVARITRA